MVTIGVLECGRPPADLQHKHAMYPVMVGDLLLPHASDGSKVESWAVMDGKIPSRPDLCDAWVLTGSKYSVLDENQWIRDTEAFVRQAKAAGVPVVGICFGHQLIAQALGGTVKRSDGGFLVGDQTYANDAVPMPALRNTFSLCAFHEDQVVKAPEGAEVIASSPQCPIAGLHYPGWGLSVQAHPEFSIEYTRDLISSRRGTVLSEELADKALANLPETNQSVQFGALMAGFIADINASR